MTRIALRTLTAVLLGAVLATAAKPLPVDDPKKAAVALLDDHAERLIPYLTNDEDRNGRAAFAAVEEVDVFAGATALKVGPLQRFRAEVPGWSYPIRETPKAGEFRYIRFAWKKVGGTSITMQIHTTEPTADWRKMNYYAGAKYFDWNLVKVGETIPTEWTVVTRDLFKDFGPRTITGLAYTTTDGSHGLFDHVLLGRTVADLDAKSDELLGKTKPKDKLDGKVRDDAWAAFDGRDAEKAGPAIRAFLATAPDQVGFVRERLSEADGLTPEQRKAQRKRIAELVLRLGDEDFDTRNAADGELAKFGESARWEIVDAMQSPDPEIAFRAKRLWLELRGADTRTALATIRAARVCRVLERAASDAAKKLLGEMAAGDFGSFHAAAAKAALARMGK